MRTHKKNQSSIYRSIEEFFWNLVGGSLVVAMLAGVIYALIAGFGSQFYAIDHFWEHKYFIRWFIGLLLFYLLLPKVFAAIVGGAVGTTSDRKIH